MILNLNNILAYAAIFQSLLLFLFFFQNKKGNSLSNKILGTFLGVLAVTMFFLFARFNTLEKTFLADKYPVFYLGVEFNYLLGPLLYFYIKSLVEKNFKLHPNHIIHLIPFLIPTSLVAFFMVYWKFFYFPSFLAHFFNFIHFRELDMTLILLHIISYNIACISLIIRKKKTDSSFSRDLQNSWPRFLILSCNILLMLKAIIYIVFFVFRTYNVIFYSNIAYFIVLFTFTYWVAFYTLKYPETFSFTKKYQKSDLTDFEVEKLKKKLICYIEENKIYLEPSLTITILSKKLSVSVPDLSRVINESFNTNFCDFINQYRIEESKQYLKDLPSSKKTILEIAYTVGFNSKSSFYQAFKKQTGIIPTEFVKRSSIN